MCIIASEVNDVSQTKIISFNVGYSYDNGKTIVPSQLVIYSADIDNIKQSNAIILPVYNPTHNTNLIIPLDLSKLPKIFKSVDNIFKRWFIPQMTFSNATNSSGYEKKNYLEVKKAGNYKYSILNTANDFDRINPNELSVSQHARTVINYHSNEYSFIVYQFAGMGKIEVEPFGYLSPLGQSESMIIPTTHGHPHQQTDMTNFFNRIPDFRFNAKNEFEQMSDFDHMIYIICKSETYGEGATPKDATDLKHLLKAIDTDSDGIKINIYPPKIFVPKMLNLKGKFANRNIIVNNQCAYSFLYDLNCDQIRMN